jgi:hypothetical protein
MSIPASRRTQPSRPSQGTAKTEVGHQASSFVELLRRVGGEVLRPKNLAGAVAQRDGRPLFFVRSDLGVLVQHVVVELEQEMFNLAMDRRAPAAEPEGIENEVVDGDVLVPRDERGASGPVDVFPAYRSDLVERARVRGDGTDGNVEACAPQRSRERDRRPLEVKHCACPRRVPLRRGREPERAADPRGT